MKKLIDTLKSWRAALTLASFISALFVAATTLAFSQVTFEKLWEADFTKPAKLIKNPCFSKDGKYIYFAGAGTILKYDTQTGQFLNSFDKSKYPNMYSAQDLVISPQGSYLMSHDGSTGIYFWDTKTDKACRFIPKPAYGLIMTNDEKYMILAFNEGQQPKMPPASGNSNLNIYDLEKDTIIKSIHSWGRNELLALSLDGKYLATVAYKNESESLSPDSVKASQKVFLWNTDTWIPEEIDNISYEEGGRLESGFNLCFSDDNKYIAWTYTYKSWDQSRAKLFTVGKKGWSVISDSNRSAYSTIFSPDSQTYGFCYPQVEFFDLKTNTQQGSLDYPIYQWATYKKDNLIFGYSFNNGALFKIKYSNVLEEPAKKYFSAFYKENELIIDIYNSFILPTSISIYDLKGKEIYNIRNLIAKNQRINVPINITSGLYLIIVEINKIYYSQKIEIVR